MVLVRRTFTPREANRTLPLVRRIVADVLAKGAALREALAGIMDEPARDRAEEIRAELDELLGEFDAIGCFYKDWGFERGLVDFPSVIDGEQVLLCWRSDEPAVTWYHGIEAGYAGRQRIPDGLL